MILLANMMFYGLFVVLPGTLVLFGVMLAWLARAGRQIVQRHGDRPWDVARFFGLLYLPLIVRACIPNIAICLAWRETNDPAEGDPPLQPFFHSLDGILLWSALISLPFAVLYLRSSLKKRQVEGEGDAPAGV